jgi:rhamnosyl/mannosyltransferase
MSPEKYLQIGKFYPPQRGGIETVTYNIEEALSEFGLKNNALVFGNASDPDRHSLNADNIIRVKYKSFFGAPFSIGYFRALKKINGQYSHIIAHLPNPWAIICLLMISFKGKLILYWHSDIVNKGIFGYLIAPFECWIIKKASVIIAPTLAHIKFSKYSSLLSKKFQIIPYPIDNYLLKIAQKSTPRNLPTPTKSKPLRLVCTGRLVNYKGFEYLINSIPLTLKIIPCTLDIIGDGPLKGNLNRLIYLLNLKDRVRIHGTLSNDHLHTILSQSDIYCLPSNTNAEMYGMVQYEAMAHGLPIIASNISKSGVPILISDTGAGILFKPNDAADIASAIFRIAHEPGLYNRLSRSGLDSIKNKFSADKFLQELIKAT